MAVFVVISTLPNPTLKAKIQEAYPNDHYVLNDRTWLVSGDYISSQVSNNLRISDGDMGQSAVFTIDGYYGWHEKQMWEWLSLKEA